MAVEDGLGDDDGGVDVEEEALDGPDDGISRGFIIDGTVVAFMLVYYTTVLTVETKYSTTVFLNSYLN